MSNGTIVTFYSYKGGVGRSFILANVATLLSEWGFRVLCVDWDMEAPGLQHFFRRWIKQDKPGLLELVERFALGEQPEWKSCVTAIDMSETDGRLDLMTAGRLPDNYVQRVQEIDWSSLYAEHDFGGFLEDLRTQWSDQYDFILIDSRTGLTDIGGICTVQLPEILVFVSTTNRQSLDGVTDFVRRAIKARNRLPYDRAALLTVPVLSRFDAGEEYDRAAQWFRIFSENTAPFCTNWVYTAIRVSDVLDRITIPYVAKWSFGEELPVLQERVVSSKLISYYFETLTALIAHRLDQTDLLIENRDSYVDAARRAGKREGIARGKLAYDVFLSVARGDEDLATKFAQELRKNSVRVFVARDEEWRTRIHDELDEAAHMVVFISARLGKLQEQEVYRFMRQSLDEKTSRQVIPVLMKGVTPEQLPGALRNTQYLEIEEQSLESLAGQIVSALGLPHVRLVGALSGLSLPSNLEALDLGDNELTQLPPEIGLLANLRTLDLRNNKLTQLPPEIGQLTKLEEFELSGNRFTSPPPQVVEQGERAILAYLRGQLEASRRQWVSKLLVVGQGGVGKTAMLRALRGEPFDPELSTTHGISRIEPLELEHPTEAGITMTLYAWDCGGQEIYHTIYQVFMAEHSLFLAVWNARHGYEQGRLYYWLDTIQARAPESPVLLVATHIDERDADLPLAELRAKYPQIVGHCEISNKTGEGIEELRKAITDAAASLPLMGASWPATWLKAAEAIRAREEKHITPQELWDIMAAHGVSGDNARILAQLLHELGDILYYQDDEELNDIVILKPQWVTEYISEVLESEEVIGRLGIFTHAHMRELWGDLPPALQNHFLRLMEQFDLSYRTLENRDISLVVERLPLDPPDYAPQWDAIRETEPCREISMRFKLNTIPAGIPTWFIARSHRFTTYTHWRTGALFADNREEPRHLALVQALPHERILQLTVRGPSPYNFFALLKDGIEVSLARFPGLSVERMIPCPGHSGRPCGHEFNYDHLVKAIERDPPVRHLQCPLSYELVSVPSLLFGLHWRAQDAILLRIDQLEESDTCHIEELLALLQREFTKSFTIEQSKIESHCPNVFVLRPVETAAWKKSLVGQKIELQLYCQAPGEWHPTIEGGRYAIEDPANWIKATAPYLRKLVTVLKYAAPLAGPFVGVAWPVYEEMFKNDVKLMTELVEKLPDLEEGRESGLAEAVGETRGPDWASGAALRALRQLLDEKDPEQHWGGLRKVLTPEGHYLWLCEYHAQEYAL